MVAAIDSGFPQREIERSAYDFQRAIEKRENIVVGVNEFVSDEDSLTPVLKIDPAIELEQKRRIVELRSKRSEEMYRAALTRLRSAATSGAALFPEIIAALKAEATLGEISDVFRDVFGEHS
jgi:methylmalonyl-CoA mutase N-terminal domain/subunit